MIHHVEKLVKSYCLTPAFDDSAIFIKSTLNPPQNHSTKQQNPALSLTQSTPSLFRCPNVKQTQSRDMQDRWGHAIYLGGIYQHTSALKAHVKDDENGHILYPGKLQYLRNIREISCVRANEHGVDGEAHYSCIMCRQFRCPPTPKRQRHPLVVLSTRLPTASCPQ